MVIFFNFSPTSSHLHPLQAENCDSNSRLVVDEDDNGKLRLKLQIKLAFNAFKTKINFEITLLLFVIQFACNGYLICLFCFFLNNFDIFLMYLFLLHVREGHGPMVLESGILPMLMPAVRFRILLGAGF